MGKKFFRIVFALFLLSLSVMAWAAPPLPTRIGGTVTVDGTQLTQATATGYTFEVTKLDGTAYVPAAEDTDGLNASNWYIIDIPIYDQNDQPGGAKPGDTALIHVYKDAAEWGQGHLIVGDSGSTTQMDLVVNTTPVDIYVDAAGSCGGNTPCYATVQGGIDWAYTGSNIKVLQGTYNEDVLVDQAKNLALLGGWDATFTNQSSFTVIVGTMTISSGRITVERLVLQ